MTETYTKRPIVLIDCDDTLLDFGKAERAAIKNAFTELGIDSGEATLKRYSEINLAHWEMLEKGLISRGELLVSRFAELFKEMGVDTEPQLAQNKYEGYLSVGHYFMPGAEETIKELYAECRLFLVSNGNAKVQAGRLKSADISKYFEGIFISENIGYNKPSIEYFDECFRRISDFSRERAIMVGDSLTSDILGGINAGVLTCWYNPQGKAAREDIKPDYEISELSQLPPLIRKLFCE